MAEEARLESVCTPKGYREFESRSLRKSLDVAQLVAHLVRDQEVAGSSPVIQTKGYESVCRHTLFILMVSCPSG